MCVDGQCRPRPCVFTGDCPAGQSCQNGICQEPVCGDGRLTPPEECDDGRRQDGDGCSAQCRLERCNADTDCPDGTCGGGICRPPECTYDEDCPGNLLCRNNRCVPRCTQDGQCGINQQCRNGDCVTPCRTDAQCPTGELCENGVCRDPACDTDSDCASGMCQGGRCTDPECQGDQDCDPGEFCRNNRCRATCASDRDCPGGQCVRGVCGRREDDRCTVNDECAAGLCLNGRCAPCQSHVQCGPGRLCIDGVCAGSVCGNGIREGAEVCDDGNSLETDGCSRDCRRTDGAECTLDDQCASGVCRDGTCRPCVEDGQCGGGLCQDGRCTGGRLCGNGVREGREECDDRNARDGDGCAADCLLERGTCGDGIVQTLLDEQCDPGLQSVPQSPAVPCDPGTCRFRPATCGNGTVDAVEACDAGPRNSNAPSKSPQTDCREDCSRPRCGDGAVDVLETCDDGNRVSLDGCDRFCKQEKSAGTIGGPGREVFELDPPGRPGETARTGPGVVAAMAAGAAAGYAWMRRRKR